MYLNTDKFDQFWAVNRKLMEASGEQDHFKHIPFRLYKDDSYRQKLVKPVNDQGQRKTLGDLLKEMYPDKEDSKYFHYILFYLRQSIKV